MLVYSVTMKRGRTEVTTKLNNYYQGGKDLVIFGNKQDGSAGLEIYRDAYGGMTMGPNSQIMDDIKNIQNLDLMQAYKGQSFLMPSKFIPASIINARNIPLISRFCAIWPTTELNFHVTREEWNQIEYTDVAEGGIPDEPTFSTWGWTTKLGKKKQSVTMSLNLAFDPQKGGMVLQKNLAVLASDAVLTLLKEIAYALYMTAWGNLTLEKMRATRVTLPLLYRAESSDFMIFALDQAKAFGRVNQIAAEIGATDVLMPSNSKEYLNHVKGESVNVNGSIISELDDNKKPLETNGPASIVTSGKGLDALNYFQMNPFATNSRLKEREDPSVTVLTLCNAYPCDPNVSLDNDVKCDAACSEALDTFLFHQTENNGEMRRIPRKELIRSCFMYDKKTGYPSHYVQTLKEKLNLSPKEPWSFREKDDINDEDLTYGYDNPHRYHIKPDPNLANMKEFRSEFFGLTWDPVSKRRKIPTLLGDFTLSAMPNELFLRNSKLAQLAFEKESSLKLEDGVMATLSLLERIRSEPITLEYNYALLDTNLVYLPVDYADKDKDKFFPTNEFGSLRLPGQSAYGPDPGNPSPPLGISSMLYPPYFDNGPGLYTLAKQANNAATQWGVAGDESRKVIRFLESFAKFLLRVTGHSEAIHESNLHPDTAKKIKDKVMAAVCLLIDLIGGRRTTIDIGIPGKFAKQKAGVKGAATSIMDQVYAALAKTSAAAIAGEIAKLTFIPPIKALRALASLNENAMLALKYNFVKYMKGEGDEKDRKNEELLFDLILDWTKDPVIITNEIISVVSAMAQGFYAEDVTRREEFLKTVKSQKLKALIDTWKTHTTLKTNFLIGQTTSSFRAALNNLPTTGTHATDGDATANTKNNTATLGKVKNVKVVGDYTKSPKFYLHTTMSSSNSLIEFYDATNNLWIVPSKEPIQKAIDTEAKKLKEMGFMHLGGLLKSFDGKMPETQSFTPLHSNRGNSTPMNTLLNFGAPFRSAPQETHQHGRWGVLPATAGGVAPYFYRAFKDIYFGPWAKRWEFSNSIQSLGLATLFRVFIQSLNHMDTHLKGVDYGLEWMNFLIFRPFIEFEAKSAIVMQTGPQTMLLPFSRPSLMMTIDERGELHVSSEFYTATVVAIPENIRMLYACMPHRWRGGKNTTPMDSPEQWDMENPYKPSMIIMPTPFTERNYKTPINMTNAPSFYKPGVDTDIHLRKYSSSEFYMTIFGNNETSVVEALHMTRTSYWKHIPVHHVGHIGPRTFPDRNTLELIDLPGHGGPGTDIRMNIPGAEKTWAGEAYYFPHVVPNVNIRKRHM